MSYRFASRIFVLTALSAAACAPDLTGIFDTSGSGDTGTAGQGGTTTGTGGGGTTTTSAGGTTTTSAGGTTSSTTTCDSTQPNSDTDQDGWSVGAGDCDDCNPAVNPGAIEIPGNAADENCDGALDEPLPTCDDDLVLDSTDAAHAVQAMDLCKFSGNVDEWGIIEAGWVMPDGAQPQGPQLPNLHIGHGILSDFGPNVPPRGGKKLLALSSGTARRPTDTGYQAQSFDKGYSSGAATGFPQESPSCPGALSGEAHDGIALRLLVRIPTNVHGFSFDFSFYAQDVPQYVCTQYNDVFFTYTNPPPPNLMDGNVGYDELGSPVTLNGAHFRVCGCMNGPPCSAGGKTFDCPLGIAQLAGTGFDQAVDAFTGRGATGWLTTTVPVEPGSQISLRWGVYDAGDGIGDSTVILDHWQWITDPAVTVGTTIAQ